MLIKKKLKILLSGVITASMIVSTTIPLPVLAESNATANENPSLYSAPLKTEIYKDTSGEYSFAERAADLVSRMTVAEKASQSTGSMSPAIPRLGISKYQWWNEALHGFAATSPETASGMGTMPSYGTSVPNSTSYPRVHPWLPHGIPVSTTSKRAKSPTRFANASSTATKT
jgi:beta-glucosidase